MFPAGGAICFAYRVRLRARYWRRREEAEIRRGCPLLACRSIRLKAAGLRSQAMLG
jgi:hypothetical protein